MTAGYYEDILDTVKLEQRCPVCQGSKAVTKPDVIHGSRETPCAHCDATGLVPSEWGQKVLTFMAKYLYAATSSGAALEQRYPR